MRNLLLTFIILSCVLFTYGAEKNPANTLKSNTNVKSDQQNQTTDFENLNFSAVEKITDVKASKIKTFFGKVKHKISSLKYKAKKIYKIKEIYILPFLLGFLFGPFGILIVFLINLKKPKPERKAKVLASVSGWALALAIISIILLI